MNTRTKTRKSTEGRTRAETGEAGNVRTRVAAKRGKRGAASPRPLRGTPEQTRERLIATAATVFNRDGYDGTDSNRIAQEAGYSAGVFYKHFADKAEIFIAVYDAWVDEEWRALEQLLETPNAETPRALVATVLGLHRRWKGFRRSLRALAGRDAVVKRGHLRGRKRQLDTLERMRQSGRVSKLGTRAGDLMLLYTLERVADALAESEPSALDVNDDALIAILESLVAAALAKPSP